nr:hypothetical protein [Tanacetum cinerariifolium]
MLGSDIDGYTARFHKLARLVPHMVTLESQRVNRYIWGLAPKIKAHDTSSKPNTIKGAVSMANRLTTDGIKDGIFKKKENARKKEKVPSTCVIFELSLRSSSTVHLLIILAVEHYHVVRL